MITAARRADVKLKNIVMAAKSHHTVFLMFDRPAEAKPGTWWPFEVLQAEAGRERVIGGLSGRIEIVPAPKASRPKPGAARRPASGPRRGAATA
jgi:hypothetical protein